MTGAPDIEYFRCAELKRLLFEVPARSRTGTFPTGTWSRNVLAHAVVLPRRKRKIESMNPLRRFSLFLWLLLSHLPPISPGRLLMPAVFLSSWTALQAANVQDSVAFVWAGVLAQAAQVWGNLPVTVWRQRHAFGRARTATNWAVAILICFLAFQIWRSDPWLSQRLVSIYCALYAAIMAVGVWGDRDVVSRFAPMPEDTDVPLEFRRHLLRLYALVAILVVVTNEALLALNTTLSARVVTLSLLPLALHYFFAITLFLTYPPLDDSDG